MVKTETLTRYLNFFNLTVYLVFSAIAIVFIILSKKKEQDLGSAIVFGWIATAINLVLAGIILSTEFTVITGVTLLVDADYYLAAISLLTALYTALASMNVKRSTRVQDTESVF